MTTAAPEEGAAHDGRPYVHPETLAQWRAWLAREHDRPDGVWVYAWKRSTGRPFVDYEELVTEALAWGWIDSTAGTVDGERGRLWCSPRRKGSGWSRPNKVRVERLHAEGRMQPAGRAVLDAALADGSWSLLDDVEDLVVPADLAAALDASAGRRDRWDALPPSVRKQVLLGLVQAKREPTRLRRVQACVEALDRGERPA